MGQDIERNAILAQIKNFLDVVGASDHVRHQEGRAYKIAASVAFKFNASQKEQHLFRRAFVVEKEALREGGREELRMKSVGTSEMFAEERRVSDTRGVKGFRLKVEADRVWLR